MNHDEQSYRWAGYTLQAGMYSSFACMVGGLVWWLSAGAPGGSANARQGIALDRIWAELTAGNPLALLNLGVALLLFTPAITLLTQIVTFALARNWLFTAVATFVGAVLLLGLAISFGWLAL
jgi:uncharacterized membrane protein